MSAEQSDQLLCDRIQQCCVNLLAPAGLGMLATQVRRVIFQITSEDERPSVLDPLDVARCFKRRQLIPPVLFEKLEELEAKLRVEAAQRSATPPPSLADMAYAVAFAACLFPQRSLRTSEQPDDDAEAESPKPAISSARERPECVLDEELGRRVACFWTVIAELRKLTGARACLWRQVAHVLDSVERLPAGLPPAELEDFLIDLCAAEQSLADQHAEPDDRRAGAALYLATCDAGVVDWIVQTWRLDAELIRFLRRAGLSCPPSLVTGANAENDGYPDWNHVGSRLSEMFSSDARLDEAREKDEKVIGAAIILEQTVWKRGRLYYADKHNPPISWVPADVLAEVVRSFWQELFLDKLNSGFPYFAFRSRFTRWWSQCAIFHSWPDLALSEDDDNGVVIIDHSETKQFATFLKEILFIREGYRLLRLMFFRLTTGAKGDGQGETASVVDGPSVTTALEKSDAVASANDKLRRALDLVFHYYVLLEDADVVRPSFEEIGRPGGFKPSEITNWRRRLRERLDVYVAARVKRKTNQVIAAELSDLADGWIHFACLVRILPHDQSLLWLLTARVFLYGFLPERHRDPCTFERFLRELWHWAHDDHLLKAIDEGTPANVALSSRMRLVEDTIYKAWLRPPLRRLWDDLKMLKTSDALESYLTGRCFAVERAAALDLLGQVIGAAAFARCNQQSFDAWCKIAGRRKYWVIPVWYLTFVEKLAVPTVLQRLRIDPNDKDELAAVTKLAHAMQ
ncbi:MAG: hypothetical protein L0Y58_03085 [Verrucomicrobia subdivision 3 bacterium]|nr:hypothetical protein [Limisphaerales bacterium]